MVRACVQVMQSVDSIKTGVRQKTNAAARQPRFGHIGKVLIDTIRGVCEEPEKADPGTHSRGAKMPIRLRWHTNERAVGSCPTARPVSLGVSPSDNSRVRTAPQAFPHLLLRDDPPGAPFRLRFDLADVHGIIVFCDNVTGDVDVDGRESVLLIRRHCDVCDMNAIHNERHFFGHSAGEFQSNPHETIPFRSSAVPNYSVILAHRAVGCKYFFGLRVGA